MSLFSLLASVVICPIIIIKLPPSSDRISWFQWKIEFKVAGQLIGLASRFVTSQKKRMQSSRIRTPLCSSHLGGGVCPDGVSTRGVSAWGGVCLGVSAQGRVSTQGGCVCPGGCLPGGEYTSPCGQTDTSENITFLQLLLRTVTSNGTTGVTTFHWYDTPRFDSYSPLKLLMWC